MTQTKGLVLLVIGVVLAIFTVEIWHFPDTPLKFLGLRFMPLPHGRIVICTFLLGFVVGWATSAVRTKTHQKHAEKIEEPSKPS